MTLDISVIIPAYNAARWLGRALDSVVAQTLRPREVIVVDDGSTDETAAVAARYAPVVTCIRQTNGHVSAARNRGAAEATGEWLAFLDADDEWFPDKLERQAAILRRHPDLAWCCCNCVVLRSGRNSARIIPPTVERGLRREARVSFFEAAAGGLSLQTSGFVLHRGLFEEAGGFDIGLKRQEDRDLWWRIAFRHAHVGYDARPLYRYYADTAGSLGKVGQDRTDVIENICKHARSVQTYGPAVAADFRRYARPLVADYLLRAAGGLVRISPGAVLEASRLFPPSGYQRLLTATVGLLPRPIARRMVHRLCR
ncbi:MAG: glycosyltransferase family 2 protein [Phycisphaerae bacterium]|jgi:glycosyltransferase involved in cell wall biosynthesis